MPGLVPGIHVLFDEEEVDGRDRRQVYVVCENRLLWPGHDERNEHEEQQNA
jgi:hypothetical protein